MAAFDVTLNAQQLAGANPNFGLQVLPGWMDAAAEHVVSLEPGRHQFFQPGGALPAVYFELHDNGTVSVPAGGFVTTDTDDLGRPRVNFVGFAVTLNVQRLNATCPSYQLDFFLAWADAAVERTLQLMPRRYQFFQPGGALPAVYFELLANGTVSVPAGGFVTGRYPTTSVGRA